MLLGSVSFVPLLQTLLYWLSNISQLTIANRRPRLHLLFIGLGSKPTSAYINWAHYNRNKIFLGKQLPTADCPQRTTNLYFCTIAQPFTFKFSANCLRSRSHLFQAAVIWHFTASTNAHLQDLQSLRKRQSMVPWSEEPEITRTHLRLEWDYLNYNLRD